MADTGARCPRRRPRFASASARRLLLTALAAGLLSACGGSTDTGTGAGAPPSVGASAAGGAQSADTTVRIDTTVRHQVIDGFGASERVFSDPHVANSPTSTVPPDAQRQVLQSLISGAGLSRLRAILDPPQSADPPYDFHAKLGDDHIALMRLATGLGLRTFFAAPVGLEQWMLDSPAKYVDWAVTMLLRFKQMGVDMPLYSPSNEPSNVQGLPSGWLDTVVSLLGPRMQQAGLSTRLVIPDDIDPVSAVRQATSVLGDPRSRPFVAALAYHLYASDPRAGIEGMKALGAQYHLPVWMTEFSAPQLGSWPGSLEWARDIHELLTLGDVSAVDYLWGFFGSHEKPHTLISLQLDGGTYQGETPQPVYSITEQYARFARPGCVRVDAVSDQDDVLTTAFTCPDRSIVVVAINDGAATRTVSFGLHGATLAVSVPMRMTRTSAREDAVDAGAPAATDSAFLAPLPPQSITTVTGTLSS
ncbi:MAG TPA: glycoside hydrolase family 30 beta sandwich domain-containing protein [Candidatus Dormibacteraeota bacterium]|nr:glycoside hydrolase family 30 beta sandwich domain-containing protein [Candidatus Dormibacteraeota bacterium]